MPLLLLPALLLPLALAAPADTVYLSPQLYGSWNMTVQDFTCDGGAACVTKYQVWGAACVAAACAAPSARGPPPAAPPQ